MTSPQVERGRSRARTAHQATARREARARNQRRMRQLKSLRWPAVTLLGFAWWTRRWPFAARGHHQPR